jgi:hypothetical protein
MLACGSKNPIISNAGVLDLSTTKASCSRGAVPLFRFLVRSAVAILGCLQAQLFSFHQTDDQSRLAVRDVLGMRSRSSPFVSNERKIGSQISGSERWRVSVRWVCRPVSGTAGSLRATAS